VKFTQNGGKIHIATKLHKTISAQSNKSDEDYIEVSVTDNGIGIEKEHLEFVFHPFEQVDNCSVKKHPGTGLGLSLTRSLIELHGGKIWVESEGAEKGSTFRFTLPIK
jgi:signal transduction histidine kinase